MTDKKTAIVLAILIISVFTVLGVLWHLAVKKSELMDNIDPQPNLSQGAS